MIGREVTPHPEQLRDIGKPKVGQAPLPAPVVIYQNMKVFLTKNMDKRNDFVNGMAATIESYDCSTRSVTVMTMSPDVILFSLSKGSPRRGSSRKDILSGGT